MRCHTRKAGSGAGCERHSQDKSLVNTKANHTPCQHAKSLQSEWRPVIVWDRFMDFLSFFPPKFTFSGCWTFGWLLRSLTTMKSSTTSPSSQSALRFNGTSWNCFTCKVGLLDSQREVADNGLGFMAKHVRTQPTSQNSIPTSLNLDFRTFFLYVCDSHVLGPQIVHLQFYLYNV